MTRINGDPTDQEEITLLRQTEAEVERSRERLAASLGALRADITGLTDWREWIRRQPLPFVAGAAALGFWIGWRASGQRRD
jgi:hypothetical protein